MRRREVFSSPNRPKIRRFLFRALLIFAILLIAFLFQPRQQRTELPAPYLERLELVTDQALDENVPNGWGYHKSRIVRTLSGDIFVVYNTAGKGISSREWRLVRRSPTGEWTQINQGNAGVEPINILRGPQDELNLFTWPDAGGTLQYIHSTDDGRTFTTSTIPGSWKAEQGYSGSGINAEGNMAVFQTDGDHPGHFLWAYYTPNDQQWHFHNNQLDYRYTYAYFMPGENNDLTITGMRDVEWSELGYQSVPESFGYVFNAIKYFYISNVFNPTLTGLLIKEEPPGVSGCSRSNCTSELTYLVDSYVDTEGCTHILYDDAYSGGHHAIVQNGVLIKDVPLRVANSFKSRIIQDTTGRFYIIDVNA